MNGPGKRAPRCIVVISAAIVALVAGALPARASAPTAPTYRLGPAILDDTGVPQPAPVQIAQLKGVEVIQVAANDDHVLALGAGGLVFAWGSNYFGQLGDGTHTDEAAPERVALPPGVGRVVKVAAGYGVSLAVTSTGRVLTWGAFPGDGSSGLHLRPTVIALPHSERATDISSDEDFIEYVTRSGEIWGWGNNLDGQLGDGHVGAPDRPVQAHLPAGFVARSVATGIQHSLALGTNTLTGNTEVLAWGSNIDDELGAPGVSRALLPVVTAIPAGAGSIRSISADGVASGALSMDGAVYTWGATDIGPDQAVPTALPLPGGVTATALSIGVGYSLVTTSANQLLGWGVNTYGGLGPDVGEPDVVPTVVPLPGGTIEAIAHDFYTTYVVL